jgi:choline dehydrogenase-like flavoprotein
MDMEEPSLRLTSKQAEVLGAICDAFVPRLNQFPFPARYGEACASEREVDRRISELLSTFAPAQQREFRLLLSFMGSPLLGLSWLGPWRGFLRLDPQQKEAVLRSWSRSPFPPLRKAFCALRDLTLFIFYSDPAAGGSNPLWEAIGYPGPLGARPTTERSLSPLHLRRDSVLECDTVVVGSGAGGCVVAAELAAAGHRVVVVEKGPYLENEEFTEREGEMIARLYEAKGALSSADGAVTVFAGSCLGGGTTVNWAGSLRTPESILEEWAEDSGCRHFMSQEYSQSFDAVEAILGVNPDAPAEHNPQNLALLRGAQAAGYRTAVFPRNTRGCDERSCGYCGFGCRKGTKRSTVQAFLRAACREHGAQVLADTRIARVLIERGEAVGVEGQQRDADGASRAVRIRARRVVVSAGGIHSPAILRRSGLIHPQIGRNLYLHPTVAITGGYQPVMSPWWGPMMSAVCDEFSALDGGYGTRIETVPAHTGLIAMGTPWLSGRQHKEAMLEAAHLGVFMALTRDRDPGRIDVDRRGEPLIRYRLSPYDRGHVLKGIEAAARIHRQAGARKIYFPHGSRPIHDATSGQAGLEAMIREMPAWDWRTNRFSLFSAHQMGSCRIGASSKQAPLTPEAETREVRNLFVADASAFPSSSGVNPMVSIQALAHFVAQGIKARS